MPKETTESNGYERRKERAIARMNEALRAEYETLGTALAKADSLDARNRYEIGVIVRRVSDASTYGDNAVKLVSAALGMDKNALYDAVRVVTCWSKKAFEALLARPTHHRRPLSFSHLVLLAAVTNTTKRQEYLETCLKFGLPVRELERLVEARKSRARGRHPTARVKTIISHAKTVRSWLADLEPRVAATRETRKLLQQAADEHRLLLKEIEAKLNGSGHESGSGGDKIAEEQDESDSFRMSGKSPSALWGGHAR